MFKVLVAAVWVLMLSFLSVYADEPMKSTSSEKPDKPAQEAEIPKFEIPPQKVTVGTGYDTSAFKLPVATDSLDKELLSDIKPFTLDSVFTFTPGI
ncbi:MAG: hypothetical protein N2234_06195, partial [Planctomycetota bacterium]|nr:hypothetical protein [Planctomycetota bacterium]